MSKNGIGFDIGLATFGAVVVGAGSRMVREVSVFHSRGMDATNWRIADDLTRRARELARWLDSILGRWSPAFAVCEALPFFDNLKAQTFVTLGYGVLCSAVERRLIPMTTVGPRTWRKAICGESNEPLAHQAAMLMFPTYKAREDASVSHDLRLHARDAMGVYAWGEKSGITRGYKDDER